MSNIRSSIFLVLILFCFFIGPESSARADGGTVRLSTRLSDYQITVFTAPTPFRAGPVDVSVFIQDAATGEPISDAQVTVECSPRGQPEETIRTPATAEAATNKLFRAALFELPKPGWWDVAVAIDSPQGAARVALEIEAAPAAPRWLGLWPWITWPAVAIVLFGIHQLLVQRRHR